jgi:hypothetical protein
MQNETYQLTPAEQALMARVTVKNIKHFDGGCGHRGCNYTVYLDNKRIATMADNGWGGEVDYTFVNDKAEAAWKAFVEDNQLLALGQKMWSFMKPNTISSHDIMTIFSDAAHNLAMAEKERKKAEKKIAKLSETAILFGTWEKYAYYAYKRPLAVIVQTQKGREVVQDSYQKALSEIQKEGGTILNTPEQLNALGLTD